MKRFVMCNQAADLDSIACCTVLAQTMGEVTPFIPIPREDLHLRREAEWLLKECGISFFSLKFLGEVDIDLGDMVFLVDHNVLPREFAYLDVDISGIIDHHKDESNYDGLKVIKPAGSCASVLVKQYMRNQTELSPDQAKLLLGAILIDTRCLAPRHPTTDLDREAAMYLANIAGCDMQALYNQLWSLKSDLSVFTPQELLRKDYKEIAIQGVKCGFCAIYGALDSISGNLMEEAEKFRLSRQLNYLVLMSAFYEGDELRKELALLPNCGWNHEALAYLNSKGAQLEPKTILGGIQVYNQKNTDYSRKQILPFIKEMIG